MSVIIFDRYVAGPGMAAACEEAKAGGPARGPRGAQAARLPPP
ncbi:hypothetical protein [Sorangium sp. So ce363]